MTAKQKEEFNEIKEKVLNQETEIPRVVEDLWSKHNFGTRMALGTFLMSYFIVVMAGLFGVIMPDAVITMVWYSAMISYLTVTLGINGLEILLKGIAKIKLGGK